MFLLQFVCLCLCVCVSINKILDERKHRFLCVFLLNGCLPHWLEHYWNWWPWVKSHCDLKCVLKGLKRNCQKKCKKIKKKTKVSSNDSIQIRNIVLSFEFLIELAVFFFFQIMPLILESYISKQKMKFLIRTFQVYTFYWKVLNFDISCRII